MSSVLYQIFDGSNIIDGIYAPIDTDDLSSLAATLSENNPWMQIDLTIDLCISAVKIWNAGVSSLGIWFLRSFSI